MAEFAMWGPEHEGSRVAELDMVANRLKNMQALHHAGQLAEIPGKIEYQRALTREHNAKALVSEAEYAATMRFQAALAQHGRQDAPAAPGAAPAFGSPGFGGAEPTAGMELGAAANPQAIATGGTAGGGMPASGPKPLEMGGYLRMVGLEAIRAGLPTKGADLLAKAQTIETQAQTQLLNAARAAKEEILATKGRAEMIGNLAGTVRDQPSLDNALAIAQSKGLDISGIPRVYNAQTAPFFTQLRDSSIDAAKQAELRLREIDTNTRKATSESTRATNAVRQREGEARIKRTEAQTKNYEKNGGKGMPIAGAPSAADRQMANAIIDEMGLKFDNDEEEQVFRLAVAAEARAAGRRNKGMNADRATRMAIGKLQEEGSLKMVPSLRDYAGGFLGRKAKFTGGGLSPVVPLQVPIGPNSKPDPSKMIHERYYVSEMGVGRWNAHTKQMELVGGTGGSGPEEEEADGHDVP